jgi:predicted aspartyl protease
MSKIQHFAFRQEYQNLSFRLITDAEIFVDSSAGPGRKGVKVRALWDTGASGTVITPEVSRELNLVPIDRVKVAGVNSVSIANVAQVSIGLPNQIMVEDINVMICDLKQDFDLLIGMNIILLGDFSISNGAGKTLFSFAIPSFKSKTDHYEKARAINRRSNLFSCKRCKEDSC